MSKDILSILIDNLEKSGASLNVLDLFCRRKQLGLATYGTLLYPKNGRDAIKDLVEELADACAYALQAKLEGKLSSDTSQSIVGFCVATIEYLLEGDNANGTTICSK